ncbi:hypothetical protein [Burkholderia multivorans]|uniref:hypothetical protein n=1 Tax=Burkholderia multivorans TaxID=87883 RepID=UPI00155B21A4|nr:hypothetical protein [Burkholderia multivorans]
MTRISGYSILLIPGIRKQSNGAAFRRAVSAADNRRDCIAPFLRTKTFLSRMRRSAAARVVVRPP